MTEIQDSDLCCCGSGTTFAQCCGPLLAGNPAPTAEALMRSRYSAFVCGRMDYLKETLAPEAREDYNPEETEQWVKKSHWLGLDIRATTGGGAKDKDGTVEFVARYKLANQHFAHHELASFNKDATDRWQYLDGVINPQPEQRIAPKIGRNDPCPCGSGKKYKKCCAQ